MRPSCILTAMAILAGTESVSNPVPPAAAGRVATQVDHVKGDDLHSIHRSKLERDWFIHTVAPDDQLWFSGADHRSDVQPSGHMGPYPYYGGIPSPNGGPLVQELSREPSMR